MGATYRFPGVVRGNLRVTGSLTVGADVLLSRGAADRLDLASGDSLNIVSGSIQVGGTTVVDSSRNITAASVTVGNITYGSNTISRGVEGVGNFSLAATGIQDTVAISTRDINNNGVSVVLTVPNPGTTPIFRSSANGAADLGASNFPWRTLYVNTAIIATDLDHDGTGVGFYGTAPTAQGAAVADASGGATVDAEARTAINALLARVRATGLIAT